ncbi:CAX-interacting protein 2 [Hibiscus syriacus]|uniref:CAX-interacting protein 2 n=1 Tax=Hibiscus syriacus TaxID=106335 RepID=A0A6A2YYU6_HIBSY|nr:CAX-interacting protein 2 [Hibiscus syriacus]
MSFAASPSTMMMKAYRGKLPLSVITVILCAFAFIPLLYTERLTFISSNPILKSKPCARRDAVVKPSDHKTVEENLENTESTTGSTLKSVILLEGSVCSTALSSHCTTILVVRTWTGNTLASKMVALISTTITGSDSPTTATCLDLIQNVHLESFEAKGFSLRKRIVEVDSVAKHSKHWEGADILAFNTYVWWMNGLRLKHCKNRWGSFANGEEGYSELDTPVPYQIGLKTWANWIDSTINPNKTRVFFTTISPIHTRSDDWAKNNGLKCFNETKPVMKKMWRSGRSEDWGKNNG